MLTTAATLEEVPPALRIGSRLFDRVRIEGVRGEVEICELIWEVSGVTQMADTAPAAARRVYSALHVDYDGESYRVDEQHPVLTMGRVPGTDVVVPTDLTSRHHAQIELRRGRFRITDASSNGTLVLSEGGGQLSLRREGTALGKRGQICLGGTPETNPLGVLDYRCE